MRSLLPTAINVAVLSAILLAVPPSTPAVVVEAASCTNKGSIATWSANTYTGICSDDTYIYGVSSAGIDRIASDGTVITLDSTTGFTPPSSAVTRHLAICERVGDLLVLKYETNSAIWTTEMCGTANCLGSFTGRLATDFDLWNSNGEESDPAICTPGPTGTYSKLYGPSGNLIQDPTTGSMYQIGSYCKTIWKMDNSMLSFGAWKATLVAGSVKTAGTADNADPLLATIDTAMFGAYLSGNIYFLDSNGLRKYAIGGGVTTLTNSPAVSGFTVGLNTAAKLAYTATTSYMFTIGNILYINDEVNHVVWGVDFADESSLTFNTLVGGSPIALGSGSADGAAGIGKLDTPKVISPMGLNKVAVMDANGVRQITGAACYTSAVGTNRGTVTTVSATTDTVFCSDGVNMYVGNSALQKIAPDGTVTTVMANAYWSSPGDGTSYNMRHCDVYAGRLYASFTIGSPIASVLVSSPGSWTQHHATQFDLDGYNGESSDPARCNGGTHTNAQTFGLVGNLIKSQDPATLFMYLIGSYCKVIWEIQINQDNNRWTSTIVAGAALTAGTTDSATATSARLDGGRFGTFFNNAIYFLDTSGLRKYEIGGAVTTLSSSPGYSGYSAGLNSVGKIQYTADSSSLVMVGNNMYINDEVNHAVHVADMSDDNNLLWAPFVGGWSTALGSGSTDGAASVAKLDTPKMLKPHGSSGNTVSLMDANGVRVLSGIPLTCMDSLPNVGTGACDPLTTCTASQYQSSAPTAYTDRLCTALTACTSSEYETTAATATSNRVCTALTVCNSGTEYESVAPTSTTDRTCTTYSVVCTGGTQYESSARSSTSDRVCSAVSTCNSASEYESAAPTATSDRVCSSISSCTSSQYETAAPTTTSDRVCATLTTCTSSQYQTSAPTTTTDRVCAALTSCTSSQYESTAPTATSDRVCTALIVCTAPQVEIVAPTATSQRVCGTPGPTTTTTAVAGAVSTPTAASSTATTSSSASSNPSDATTTTTTGPAAAGGTTTTTAATTDIDFEGQAAGPAAAVRADGGLSGGEKAGISIGVILAIVVIVAIIGFAVWRLKMSKKKSKGENAGDDDCCENDDAPHQKQDRTVSPVPEKALKYSPQETSLFTEDV